MHVSRWRMKLFRAHAQMCAHVTLRNVTASEDRGSLLRTSDSLLSAASLGAHGNLS